MHKLRLLEIMEVDELLIIDSTIVRFGNNPRKSDKYPKDNNRKNFKI